MHKIVQRSYFCLLAAVWLSALVQIDARAAAGQLDSSFGVGGLQQLLIPNFNASANFHWNPAEDLVIQPDGKILVGGSAYDSNRLMDFTVTRFNPDGSVDTSFAVNGVFRYHFNGDDKGYSLALQPDGKIIIAGEAYLAVINGQVDTAFGLIRLNADGSMDTTFGTGGIVTTNFFASLDAATEVLLQPDGRIIATGWVTQGGVNNGLSYDYAAVRYNSDGSLDSTFGVGGSVTTDFAGFGDLAQAALLQPDGRIVVTGYARTTQTGQYDFATVRYNPDGSLDAGFGAGGKVVTTFGADREELARGIALAPDGKIVVTGDKYDPPPVVGQSGNWDVAAARYNPDGSLDSNFDGDGRFIFNSGQGDTNEGTNDVTVQPDGKILLVGDSWLRQNAPGTSTQDLMVIRLTIDGQFDSSFGNNGLVLTDWGVFAQPGPPEWGSGATGDVFLSASIVLQPDGKIVVANDSSIGCSCRRKLALARYLNDTAGPTPTPSASATPTNTPSPTPTATPTVSPTATPTPPNSRTKFDFDGDGKADISVYRKGVWYMNRSQAGGIAEQFGLNKDVVTPADYDADGKSDIAVFREGVWYINRSSDGTVVVEQFGLRGDIPQAADYDGDRSADMAVFRPSNGTWYVRQGFGYLATQFGAAGDKPVAADFDGDAKADLAVFRETNGFWYRIDSSTGLPRVEHFGAGGDIALTGDFDGDRRSNLAVFRPANGTWYIAASRGIPDENFSAIRFGISGDVPVPADYDGDGQTDIAVFRNGTWYVNQAIGLRIEQFGLSDDVPVSSALLQ